MRDHLKSSGSSRTVGLVTDNKAVVLYDWTFKKTEISYNNNTHSVIIYVYNF